MTRKALIVRLDNIGDVLLAGPAVRAVAAHCDHVTVLAGPRGAAAAWLLPGADDVLVWRAPWIDLDPPRVRADDVTGLVGRLAAHGFTDALVLTSFHQTPLPTALLLRLAGVPRIAAASTDYPGSLLDVRHQPDDDLPEAERSLSLARAAGFGLPPGDNGKLAVRRPLPAVRELTGAGPYVTAHPGASAPARRWPPGRWADAVAELTRRGRRVVLTGGAAERALTAAAAAGGRSGAAGPDRSHAAGGDAGADRSHAAGPDRCHTAGGDAGADRSHAAGANRCHTAGAGAERYAADGAVTDLGGRTSLARLAAVLAGADAVLVGNTGAAHLAAAVGTPVVSLFAPVVPAARWAPYGVPHVLLGDQSAPCRDSRAVRCPVPGHPCLAGVTAAQACDALDALMAGPGAAAVGRAAR